MSQRKVDSGAARFWALTRSRPGELAAAPSATELHELLERFVMAALGAVGTTIEERRWAAKVIASGIVPPDLIETLQWWARTRPLLVEEHRAHCAAGGSEATFSAAVERLVDEQLAQRKASRDA